VSDLPVRAVVFDMGNTLWFEARRPDERAIERMEAERLAPLVAGWGVALPDPIQDIQHDIFQAVYEAYGYETERGSLRDPSVPFIVRGALAARGVEIAPAQAEAWWRTAYLPAREFGWQLYPDSIDVLRELKEMGFRVGICTNRPFTSDMFVSDLEDYGLATYVDAVVSSADSGYMKPHLSTFMLAAERLGVAPAEAAHVGDDCAADMAGARRAGMRTVWKLNGRYEAPPCPDADHAIHDLAELLSLPFVRRAPRALVSTESLTPHEDANAERY